MAIQIIPEYKKRSSADKFAEAFSNASNSLAESVPQYLMGQQRNKEQELQNQAENDAARRFGIDLEGIRDPATRKALLTEVLKQQGKQAQFQQKESYLDKLFGGKQGLEQNQKNLVSDENLPDSQKGFDPANISDEDIARASAMDPNIGRSLQHSKDVALRDRRSQEDLKLRQEVAEKKETASSYKENRPYIDKVYDQYEDSLRRESILDVMEQKENSGELSDSGIINLLEALGLKSEWLKNPANEEYTKLSLDLLGGGTLQADYGSRVLASEFKVSLQRVPTLSQTPEGRRQIRENIKTMLLPARLKEERLKFYLDESDRTGKPLPHDLRGKILKDIKPQLEEAYDKFRQRNGRYKVKKGTEPDDNAFEKYYYLSEGNEKKALKMMLEDGYDAAL